MCMVGYDARPSVLVSVDEARFGRMLSNIFSSDEVWSGKLKSAPLCSGVM